MAFFIIVLLLRFCITNYYCIALIVLNYLFLNSIKLFVPEYLSLISKINAAYFDTSLFLLTSLITPNHGQAL